VLPKIDLVRCQDADYLLLATDDAISQHLRHRGTWEPHLVAISRMFVHGIAEPLILDIGANLGAYAVPLAKAIDGAKGVIYAYEPQRIVYYQLCGNIFLNRLDNVHAFCTAIGDADGSVSIPTLDFARTSNVGGFSLLDDVRARTDSVTLQNDQRSVETPLSRLDSLHLPQAPCLIKIDVEGAELEVLMGAGSWLNSSNYFLIEVHQLQFLEEITRLFAANTLTLDRVDQRPLPVIGGEHRQAENWWLVSRLNPEPV